MAIPVLLILAVLWAAVLVPPLFKARSVRRHGDSIGDFSYRLGVIGRTRGHAAPRLLGPQPATVRDAASRPAVPQPMTPMQRRRRDVLLVLASAVLVSLLVVVASGATMLWVVQIVADVSLVAYVVLLARLRVLVGERSAKVRYLPHHGAPQLALRRTASS